MAYHYSDIAKLAGDGGFGRVFQFHVYGSPLGGCSVTFVSPEYAAKPVQPLNPQTALAESQCLSASRMGGAALVLDERLSRAAAMQSEDQAKRGTVVDITVLTGSTTHGPRRARGISRQDRLGECRGGPEILQRRQCTIWEGSPGTAKILLRPNVSAIGVAMAKAGERQRLFGLFVLGGRMIDG